jgi:hypothetical protein
MKRLALLTSAAALLLAAPASSVAASGPVNHVIHLGQSAGGVSLFQTRSTVISELGKPYYENANGYMQYQPDIAKTLFDVYRFGGAKTSRVKLIGVSDTRFKLADGIAIFARGGLAKLKAKVGSRLKRVRDPEDGEVSFELRGTYKGHKTFTNFSGPQQISSSARVVMIFIGVV